MFQPDVSVIVPVRNGEATIADCIESLLRLAYPKRKLKLIVVDNASTDRTAELLAAHRGDITVASERRRGAAAARNRGLSVAEGHVVAFTDSDCVVDPDWLQAVVSPLHDEGVGICGGRILARQPCNRTELFGERIHDQNLAINVSKPPYVATANWSSRLSVLRQVGGFNERFLRGQDSELSRRILRAGYRLVYAPEAVVYHRNKRTFSALFVEGYRHGFWGVRSHREHRAFLAEWGYRRFRSHSWRRLLHHAGRALAGPDRHASACHAVFDAGKKLGRLSGSARWLYPDP